MPTSQNSSLVHVGDVNGTKTIVLNGTLPNGTDTTNDASKQMLQLGGLGFFSGIVAVAITTI